MYSISVLIPIFGYKEISKTIESVVKQKYDFCEILILRNGISDLPEDLFIIENKVSLKNIYLHVREILIRKRGKGNALNEGIRLSTGEVVVVLDADCVLLENAFQKAIIHFENDDVSAVGGRIIVMKKSGTILELLQNYEYLLSFELARRLFAILNAQFLISGAFGLFRKSTLIEIGGFDTDTVGEDMELVLRLQDNGLFRSNKKVIYEPQAVCSTVVPSTMKRLLHQRDRWQRGLIDSIFKHLKMLLNPLYGLLGIVVLLYEFVFELFGPVLSLIFILCPFIQESLPKFPSWGILYFVFQFIALLFSVLLSSNKVRIELLKQIPLLFFLSVLFFFYQLIISFARLFGIITFHWRRLVW